MTVTELGSVIRGIAPVLKEYVSDAVKDFQGRLTALEARVARDGKDVDLGALDTMVRGHVDRAMALLPPPKDGRSLTVDDVAPLITAEVTKALAQMPPPRNGRDGDAVVDALVDRHGHLVLTLSDGTTKDVGEVVGKSVDPDDVARLITREVAKIPPPANGKDGKDGLGFDEMELVFDESKGYRLRWTKGDRTEERPVAIPYDAGVWKPGRTYPAGAGVTVKGAFFIAQSLTSARPGDENPASRAWRMAVKGGKDGKPGRDGRDREGDN